MKTSYFTLSLIISTFSIVIGQSDSIKNFYLGHSLINTQIPQMVHELSRYAQFKSSYIANIGNGANLGWHWTQPHSGQGESWTTALVNNKFDHFIITEAIPLKSHLQWSDTYKFMDSFYLYAQKKSPNIKMLLYETWHCIDSGTEKKCESDNDSHLNWRDRLDMDTILWQGIYDNFRIKNPQADIFIIPGGQALARLYDKIKSGNVPSLTSINQIFNDNIHLTSIGNYYIACVMYSVIYNQSPVGLPNSLKDMYGLNYPSFPSPELALALQMLAWETVCSRRSYTHTAPCFPSQTNQENITLDISYDSPYIYVAGTFNRTLSLQIYNLQGQKVLSQPLGSDQNLSISTETWPSGIYILTCDNVNQRIVVINQH
jgi:hypothetical protein